MIELKLLLPLTFQSKLEKKFERHGYSALSIDGVYAEVPFTSKETEYFEITAKVAKKVFSNSTLSRLIPGNKVNIGMPSVNSSNWLLDSVPLGIVKLNYSRFSPKFYIWSHAKAPRLSDHKQVNIRNMDLFMIAQARELWRGPNVKFWTESTICGDCKRSYIYERIHVRMHERNIQAYSKIAIYWNKWVRIMLKRTAES